MLEALKKLLRPLVPNRLLAERELYCRLPLQSRRMYAKLRFLEALGFQRRLQRRVPSNARAFLFVCFGNIMRSPMAELMFKRMLAECGLEGFRVRSAGVHASPGREAHPHAMTAAADMGFSLADHRATMLDAELVEQADAILAMDFQNLAELLTMFGGAQGKIFMLSAYAEGRQRCREIPDPYFGDQDEARRCYSVLETCLRNLVDDLSTSGSRSVAAGVR